MKRGMFIVFEGGEKVGKTTQIRRLREYLKQLKYPVITSKEPGGGDPTIQEKLLAMGNTVTGEKEFELLCKDRKLHIENLIRPALREEKIVILDRFDSSTIAYQGYGRGMPIELLRAKIAKIRNGIQPDIILLLDANPEKILSRENPSPSWFDVEKMEFHHRVRQGFLTQAKNDPAHWRIVDAEQPLDVVWKDVKKHLDEFLHIKKETMP